MFTIFEEISWPHFQNLPNIQKLPLHEQVRHYNQYLNNLSYQRISYANWLNAQGGGPSAQTVIPNTGDLVWNTATSKWEEAVGTWEQ